MCIKYGMTFLEFWLITIGEAADFINIKVKKNAEDQYNLAAILSSFVLIRLSGNSVPEIERLYPSLFFEDKAEFNNKKALAQMQVWAEMHNKMRSLQNDS